MYWVLGAMCTCVYWDMYGIRGHFKRRIHKVHRLIGQIFFGSRKVKILFLKFRYNLEWYHVVSVRIEMSKSENYIGNIGLQKPNFVHVVGHCLRPGEKGL